MSKLSLAYHTIRHLRAGQVAAQVRHRIRRPGPQHFKYDDIPYPGCGWHPLVAFLPPGPQLNGPGDLLRGRFRFLNTEREGVWPPDWSAGEMEKLWRYNLHYFDWLWALSYEEARQAVLHWIHQCRAGPADAWEPYPLSLRVMNWCACFWQRFRVQLEADANFQRQLWQSLCQQLESLSARLEFHLLGNHLLENAAALTFAGACFNGADAQRWLKRGLTLLKRELPEQMLPDGMHFERSPMYHARVTYLLLLLYACGREEARKLVQPFLCPALTALQLASHSDGQIGLFNDSAFGVSNTPRELLSWAADMGIIPAPHKDAVWALPAAGYYGWKRDDGFCLICDAGPVGPDYIPGHAHADIFGFEWSYRGQRIIVDSGVFDYVPSEMRRYCRSTSAHNTVTLGGEDQFESWEAFRVARRGKPHDVKWEPHPAGFRLSAWHDGYRRLRGRPRHAREFVWHMDGVLLVRDEISGGAAAEAVSRLHFHPDCEIVKCMENGAEGVMPGGRFVVRFSGAGTLRKEESWYCPEFGKRVRNPVLSWSQGAGDGRFGFCLAAGAELETFDLEAGAKVNQRFYSW